MMTHMSNSSLVNFTRISPNKTSPRNHKIDTVTVHCVVGQCSVETLGNIFAASSRRASSNYGVGQDGRIGLYCPEQDRSWCSSSSSNDNRAITIEVASDNFYPYAVNDKAYASLIKLLVDICRRNGIPSLKWCGDKNLVGNIDKQNMTAHRWFAATDCPGEFLYSRMGKIAEEVNKQLNATTYIMYKVQAGAFSKKENADNYCKQLVAKGYPAFVTNPGMYYKIQVGAFRSKENAEAMKNKLAADGISAFVYEVICS